MIERTNSDNISSGGHRRLRHIAGRIGYVLFILITFLTVILYGVMRYLLDNWSELTMDELVFHMKSTLEGTNPDMIRDGLLRYGLPAALVLAVFVAGLVFLRSRKKLHKIYIACVLAAVAVTLLLMKSELDKKVGLSDYVIAHLLNDESDFIAEHYVNPDNVGLQFPEQKRNLIYIYLESAETTFADRANGGDFEQNVIPELTVLA